MENLTRVHLGMFKRELQIGDIVWAFSGTRGSYHKTLYIVAGETPMKTRLLGRYRKNNYDIENLKSSTVAINTENLLYAEPYSIPEQHREDLEAIQKDLKENL